jgi:N-methylhydantoinase A
LGSAIKKCLEQFDQNDIEKIERIQVSSRFLDRILQSKLGGTVAQVITKGFENWSVVRQPALTHFFNLQSDRQDPLASQDLIFGVPERVSASGQVLKSIDMTDLEPIAEKLKMMNIQRVVINFLHSSKNSENQNKAIQFFKSKGFQVFSLPRTAKEFDDEIPHWKENLLNACLFGSFQEHREEIQKGFGCKPEQIYFWTHKGQFFQNDPNHIFSSLYGWTHLLTRTCESSKSQVLWLDLENWFVISPQKTESQIATAWGPVNWDGPQFYKLRIQPTQTLEPHFSGGLAASATEVGFEPGPMILGRGLRPTVFDALYVEADLQYPLSTAQGLEKWKSTMKTYLRGSEELKNLAPEKFVKKWVQGLCHQISDDLKLHCGEKHFEVTGYFAEFFYPHLKKADPHLSFRLDPLSKERSSLQSCLKSEVRR